MLFGRADIPFSVLGRGLKQLVMIAKGLEGWSQVPVTAHKRHMHTVEALHGLTRSVQKTPSFRAKAASNRSRVHADRYMHTQRNGDESESSDGCAVTGLGMRFVTIDAGY